VEEGVALLVLAGLAGAGGGVGLEEGQGGPQHLLRLGKVAVLQHHLRHPLAHKEELVHVAVLPHLGISHTHIAVLLPVFKMTEP
jgi:hypothetical protein